MSPITVGVDDGRHFDLDEGGHIAIGGRTAEIALPGDDSGNEYAHIENRGGHPWVLPRTPTVQVQVNDTEITQATPLRSGDRLAVGALRFAVKHSEGTLRISISETQAATAPAAPLTSGGLETRRRHWVKPVLYGAFLVLLAALLFVFLSTPVSLVIEPDPSRIEFSGFPPPIKVDDRYLVLPGRYQVRASKPGYRALDVTASIEGGGLTELRYELKKLPGRVSVITNPEAAAVVVDGQLIGTTPLRDVEIEAGEHTVGVSAPRYQTTTLEFEVEGMGREQVIQLELTPDWAPVTFTSDPAGAEVIIDDRPVGTTPVTLDLLSGAHTVVLTLARHLPQEMTVDVEAGKALALPVAILTPTPAQLTVVSVPPDAALAVDGVYQGSTPGEISLSPYVEHELTLSKPGYVDKVHRIELEAAEESAVTLELEREFGVVFVTSDPIDAELLVDGKSAGTASQRLRLSTRPHVLEFRKAGYKSRRLTVTPRAGVSKELSVILERENAVSAATGATGPTRTSEGQVLKHVQPGQFTMGASRREQGRRANENLRRVELTRDYYLSVKEVTNAEFRRFKPDHDSGTAYGRSLDQDAQPVVNVSWEDAVAYLNWLSEKEGLDPFYERKGEHWEVVSPAGTGYRLPTEAEWANAARFAGNQVKKYAWDGPYPPVTANENFGDSSASGLLPYSLSGYNDSFAVSAPVGSFPPADGFHDLGGNVAEWVHDYYGVYPGETNSLTKDPFGPESGRHRVVRGAGWKDSTISELRLSYRDYSQGPRDDLGFRIARYAD